MCIKRAMLFLLAVSCFLIVSCKKEEGPGGKAELSVFVKHHDDLIPGAIVYIKFGARELPGTNPSDFDDYAVCGTEGDDLGHLLFKDIQKGDYYLYSVGYDSTSSEVLRGGIPVEIKKKSEALTVDVPVTE